MLPAASMQFPVTAAVAESGPVKSTGASQVTPPLSASVPPNETETGALYQLSTSGVRDAVAVTTGSVSSYANGNDIEELFPAGSVHVPSSEPAAVSGPA